MRRSWASSWLNWGGRLEQKLARLNTEWTERWLAQDRKIEHGLAELNAKIYRSVAETKADLMKWMFVYWVGTIVPLGGVIYLLIR